MPEVRRLVVAMGEAAERRPFRLGWSRWRRAHQAVAARCHAARPEPPGARLPIRAAPPAAAASAALTDAEWHWSNRCSLRSSRRGGGRGTTIAPCSPASSGWCAPAPRGARCPRNAASGRRRTSAIGCGAPPASGNASLRPAQKENAKCRCRISSTTRRASQLLVHDLTLDHPCSGALADLEHLPPLSAKPCYYSWLIAIDNRQYSHFVVTRLMRSP